MKYSNQTCCLVPGKVQQEGSKRRAGEQIYQGTHCEGPQVEQEALRSAEEVISWSEQLPGWDQGTHQHEVILPSKPQSPEVRRNRNQGVQTHQTGCFGMKRDNPSSRDQEQPGHRCAATVTITLSCWEGTTSQRQVEKLC